MGKNGFIGSEYGVAGSTLKLFAIIMFAYILGIAADFDGLRIDPSIPAAWSGFKATRKFRGDVYEIEVKNPDHINKGVKSLAVDGVAVDGTVIPVAGDGKTHKVEVVLG